MIIWRNGKAGFIGAAKQFIRGMFTFRHSETSIAATPPNKTFGILSIINTNGEGVESAIGNVTIGLSSAITPTNGLLSIMQTRGLGVSSAITGTQGEGSTL